MYNVNELLPYQEAAVDIITKGYTNKECRWNKIALASKGRAILGADPGSGKTVIALRSWQEIAGDKPLLIVCSRNAINTWIRELEKWLGISPEFIWIMHGNVSDVRQYQWHHILNKNNVFCWAVITTYDTGRIDHADKDGTINKYMMDRFRNVFHMIVFDECRVLRNRKKQNYGFWHTIAMHMQYCLFLDGTLCRKGPEDFWTFLYMLRGILRAKDDEGYWSFVYKYCNMVDYGGYQKIINAKQENIPLLQEKLRKGLIHITEKDVTGERPLLRRSLMRLDVSIQQKELYNKLMKVAPIIIENGNDVNDIMSLRSETISDATVLFPRTKMNLDQMIRKLLVCPKTLHRSFGYGAGLKAIGDDIEDSDDPHVVIFTPFVSAIDRIRDFLYKHVNVEKGKILTLHGGIGGNSIAEAETRMNREGSRDIIIVSIKYAASFEFTNVKKAYFLGYEWMPDDNRQAEKRLHRISSRFPVDIYYLQHRNTIDERVMQRLDERQTNVNMTLDHYEEIPTYGED